ncbi:MAG: hypothetical protein PHH77_09535 [Victivallaceae bacterium]|nr:hypothetical protein [Victivallaceae bacterium]
MSNESLSSKWYKGYTHYHTSFNYPEKQRITPDDLAEDLKKTGGSFVFCAGDHGDMEGNNYWGWNEEFEKYKKLCLVKNKEEFLFIPSLEIHLNFLPFTQINTQRKEHHACIPTLDYLPPLKPASVKAVALSYALDVESFIDNAHENNISPVLNHPYLSSRPGFNGPVPLAVPALYKFDYLELFTIDHPDYFARDFELYLKFLSYPVSSGMACCGSIDNACTPTKLLSTETRNIPATFLYVAGKFTAESLMAAWNERRSYAVLGNLRLERINPIPSKRLIRTLKRPTIDLFPDEITQKKISKIEIYRNGEKVYEDKGDNKSDHITWEDKNPLQKENHYIVHIEAEQEHLITSPINYYQG